jgi:hypothetical protein
VFSSTGLALFGVLPRPLDERSPGFAKEQLDMTSGMTEPRTEQLVNQRRVSLRHRGHRTYQDRRRKRQATYVNAAGVVAGGTLRRSSVRKTQIPEIRAK